MIPDVPRKRTPPPDKHTYQTGDGLTFWMDYVHAGAPYIAPTIRTTNPAIKLTLVPTWFQSDTVYLLHHYGTVIPFSCPPPESRMHDDRLDRLHANYPDLDLVLTDICRPFKWAERAERDIRLHDIPTSPGFASRAEQDSMTALACTLLAPLALHGPISMSHGDKPAGTVGFSTPLTEALKAGTHIRAARTLQ